MGKEVELGLDNMKLTLDIWDFAVDMGLDDVNVDMGLDDVNVELDMGLDDVNIDMGLDDINIDMGLDNVKIDMGLDDINVCMMVGIKELPSMKFHMPMNYEFGYELFGFKVFNFCVGGKSMLVTEDNPTTMFYQTKKKKPNPDEPQGIRVALDENLAEKK